MTLNGWKLTLKKINFQSYHYRIPTEVVIEAYKKGLFPMAETANSKEIYWLEPKKRGVFFFDKIKVPRKLRRIAKTFPFEIRINNNFSEVIENCSKITSLRKDTWINDTIKKIYIDMHKKGYAHSVECYVDNKMVGGLYGIAIGAVFFGESMFSSVTNASKFALFHLIERLIVGNFLFIDTQFLNKHLMQFGAEEISSQAFNRILKNGINKKASFEEFSKKGKISNTIFPLTTNII